MLRITRQSDFGIVLMTLFTRSESAEEKISVLSARDMAHDTNLHLPTVSKILKALTRSGLLESTRGVKGGYSLARPVEDISVANIIEAIEGPIALTDCIEEAGLDCFLESTCPCKENWKRVNTAVRNALAAIPLSQMNSGCQFELEATSLDRSETNVERTKETDEQHEFA